MNDQKVQTWCDYCEGYGFIIITGYEPPPVIVATAITGESIAVPGTADAITKPCPVCRPDVDPDAYDRAGATLMVDRQ